MMLSAKSKVIMESREIGKEILVHRRMTGGKVLSAILIKLPMEMRLIELDPCKFLCCLNL